MVNRIVNVGVLDDDRDNAQSLRLVLDAYSKLNQIHFPINVRTYIAQPTNKPLSRIMLDDSPDVCLIDFNLGKNGKMPMHSRNGVEVALQIKEKKPHIPMILFSGEDASRVIQSMELAQQNRVANEFIWLQKPANPQKVTEALMRVIRKPLNIAIKGYGGYSRTLAGLCNLRPDIIDRVAIDGRYMQFPDILEAFRSEYGKRVIATEGFNELLSTKPDVLLLCASDAWDYREDKKMLPSQGDFE